MTSPPFDRGRAYRAMDAFGIGLLVALTTSGGIASERITRGAFAVGLVASAAATLAAILAVTASTRRALLPQLLGAVAGIALVHALVRHEALGAMPWLSERPPQLVNDAVAAFGLLALVRACARGLDARLLAVALAGVTVYQCTSPLWHLDAAPGGFHSTVQQLVVAQLVAAALALGVYRAMADDAVE